MINMLSWCCIKDNLFTNIQGFAFFFNHIFRIMWVFSIAYKCYNLVG